MQLSNKPTLLVIPALADTSRLCIKIHRNVSIIIPKLKKSASDSNDHLKTVRKKKH